MRSFDVVGRRLVRMLVTVVLVATFTYLFLDLIPGNPAYSILPSNQLTPANIRMVDHELGLDKPFIERIGLWGLHVLQGNLGTSFESGQSVASLIVSRLPETVELMVLAQLIAIVLALAVALVSLARRRTALKRSSTLFTIVFISMPNFVLALVLVFLFAVSLHWLPANGFVPLTQSLGGNLQSMILPAFSLGAGVGAIYAQVLSAELAKTMQQDFIQFAIAKGLPRRTVIFRHALRPSSLPLVTLAAINTGVLLGGSFIVETIFALPGIGALAVNAIYDKDYLVVQGVVLFVTVSYVLINFVVDLLYNVLDPRTRHAADIS
ncbi:MAG TPA: ABC transporter permease [Acidimicrobiales bacterium]|nr:ABC transporter permease [Acidimicrobiales bacterium]